MFQHINRFLSWLFAISFIVLFVGLILYQDGLLPAWLADSQTTRLMVVTLFGSFVYLSAIGLIGSFYRAIFRRINDQGFSQFDEPDSLVDDDVERITFFDLPAWLSVAKVATYLPILFAFFYTEITELHWPWLVAVGIHLILHWSLRKLVRMIDPKLEQGAFKENRNVTLEIGGD